MKKKKSDFKRIIAENILNHQGIDSTNLFDTN